MLKNEKFSCSFPYVIHSFFTVLQIISYSCVIVSVKLAISAEKRTLWVQ